MINSLVDMYDVISGDSRQRLDSMVLISVFTGIFDSNIERKHEYLSGDSRQQVSLKVFSFISANINNGFVVGEKLISSGYSILLIARNVLIEGFNDISKAIIKKKDNIHLGIPDK